MLSTESETAQLENYLGTFCAQNQAVIRRFVRNKQLAGVRTSTIITEVLALKSLYPFFDVDVPLDTITKEQIEDWYLWFRDTPMERTGEKPRKNTLVTVVSGIRQVMESIHGDDGAATMFKQIKPTRNRKAVVKEEELLSDAEIERMLVACTGERDRAIIAVHAIAVFWA